MRMPTPTSRCFPDTASHVYNTWGNDVDGGRMLSSTITRSGFECAVQAGEPTTRVETALETGLRRVTFFTPFLVIYPENPKLNVHDVILWTDNDSDPENPVVHTIIVLGSRNPAGVGSVWGVVGEESG
jgi:hypothetical protein